MTDTLSLDGGRRRMGMPCYTVYDLRVTLLERALHQKKPQDVKAVPGGGLGEAQGRKDGA